MQDVHWTIQTPSPASSATPVDPKVDFTWGTCGMQDFEVKKIGMLDHSSLEAMLVGYLTMEPSAPELSSTTNADKLLESGIQGRWFKNKSLGLLYDELAAHYRRERVLLNTEEYAFRIHGETGSSDQAAYSAAAFFRTRRVFRRISALRFIVGVAYVLAATCWYD